MNQIYFAIGAAVLPVALLVFYIYRQDAKQPEPAKLLWKGGFYGILSAVLTIVFARFIPDCPVYDTVVSSVYTAFCQAAIPEEVFKLLMLWLLIRKNKYFDEHLDGIVYATCVGLGFAGLENIMYVVSNIDSWISVATSRAIFAVPGHFFFAVAMGYYISRARFENVTPAQRNKYYALALIVPIILHGIYDSLLFICDVEESLAGICTIIFLIFVVKLRKHGIARIRHSRELTNMPPIPQEAPVPPSMPGSGTKFCTACGTQYTDGAKFCSGCGKQL